ncbi:MAG TPA: Hsp20/alpha crystallin family protein [Leptospiraceae bacterium]|nr:Hsp20/alpha crystallin family protein [Leptospiraceae bacterium]HMW06923.1 Hsp20/alpha crystallin family protein [Leptospiraceae bacterium]HMX32285.1 Hsp20/alpha crystallin family protein [Leptospiraceae bacterium]HMY33453.1 Hsp20/alpha crystallin family protein [Leptospiraceae bacterium]HMZ65487.1 Hsp20/alpha crystallin family protein [Leptospiraceae bacterium]
MLLNVIERNGNGSSLWNELDRLHDELAGGFFSLGGSTRNYHNPPVNVYINKDEALLSALIPGYDPQSIELSVIENKVQIKGTQPKEVTGEKYELHRQEIDQRDFERTIELPFRVDAEKVDAKFKNGILNVKLPKAEADKPKKISVQLEN